MPKEPIPTYNVDERAAAGPTLAVLGVIFTGLAAFWAWVADGTGLTFLYGASAIFALAALFVLSPFVIVAYRRRK